jgi:uncharacterized membrane protein
MNKTEFINTLNNTLKERRIQDIDEIVAEYEQHFSIKLADGYSEEEIAARLGDPKALGEQFDAEPRETTMGSKAIVVIGLVLVDTIVALLFVLLFTWVIVMGAAAAAFAVAGVGLISGLNVSTYLPYMPDLFRFMLAAMLLALAVLTAVGVVYFWLYTRQFGRSFFRWHRNRLAAASGEALLPNIPIHPQIPATRKRIIRGIGLVALAVCVITLQAGYTIAALTAGALEFWHVWGWFQ